MDMDVYVLKKLDNLEEEVRRLKSEAAVRDDRIDEIDESHVCLEWFLAVLHKLHPETAGDVWWNDI